ncbi:MAG: FmdB family zinc ribbon protein [Anaerolineae bacterium]
MPSYDYRCQSCKRRVVLTYKTYKEYDAAIPICPYCQSTQLTRLIGRIAIAKSEGSRLDAAVNDPALDSMADADPATLGRYLRQMSSETGEDLGEEFHEVVGRLERGESPESIEASMPDLGAADDGGGFSGLGGASDSGADMSID